MQVTDCGGLRRTPAQGRIPLRAGFNCCADSRWYQNTKLITWGRIRAFPGLSGFHIKWEHMMFGRMRDVPAYLGGNMPIRSSQGRHYPHHRSGLRICLPSRVSKRRAMSMERQNDPSGMDLEESLSSALLVADKELGNVVREVD